MSKLKKKERIVNIFFRCSMQEVQKMESISCHVFGGHATSKFDGSEG